MINESSKDVDITLSKTTHYLKTNYDHHSPTCNDSKTSVY